MWRYFRLDVQLLASEVGLLSVEVVKWIKVGNL
jgi:hypothetical protein